MGLTEKQQKFIDEYMKTGNARQSALTAGYSESSADNASVRMLGSSAVKEEIKLRQNILREKYAHQLFMLGQKAVNTLLAVLKDDTAKNKDKIKTAQDILDRIGVIHAKQLEITGEVRVSFAGKRRRKRRRWNMKSGSDLFIVVVLPVILICGFVLPLFVLLALEVQLRMKRRKNREGGRWKRH